MPRRPRLVYVTTLPVTPFLLLRGQLAQMREWGFEVHVVCSPGPELDAVSDREGVMTHAVDIPRDPEPRGDARALVELVRLFRRLQPHIVNASTPKAGLLGMLAARIARVPVRIYLLRGLRLETASGNLLKVLAAPKLAAACAHEVIASQAGTPSWPAGTRRQKVRVLRGGVVERREPGAIHGDGRPCVPKQARSGRG
ncbi:MAG: glycosyltransferase [Myxococcota bacterium]